MEKQQKGALQCAASGCAQGWGQFEFVLLQHRTGKQNQAAYFSICKELIPQSCENWWQQRQKLECCVCKTLREPRGLCQWMPEGLRQKLVSKSLLIISTNHFQMQTACFSCTKGIEQHAVTLWNVCKEGISLLSAAVEELSLVPLLPTPGSPAAPSLTEQGFSASLSSQLACGLAGTGTRNAVSSITVQGSWG